MAAGGSRQLCQRTYCTQVASDKQHLIGPWNENILDKSSEKTRLKEEEPSVVTGCRVKGKQSENRGA